MRDFLELRGTYAMDSRLLLETIAQIGREQPLRPALDTMR